VGTDVLSIYLMPEEAALCDRILDLYNRGVIDATMRDFWLDWRAKGWVLESVEDKERVKEAT
jgi:hypothetical protein